MGERTGSRLLSFGPDPDLSTPSGVGVGVEFPQLWEAARRYVLRGDDVFQAGGLRVIAALAPHMPLGEAARLVERHFERHGHYPQAAARGGISPEALAAAHAVALAPDFTGDPDPEARRGRIVAMLSRCERRVLEGPVPGDAAAVRGTIEAIEGGRRDFTPRYPS